MSTIRVRRLDANHDPVYGQGQSDFLTDLDAVAQIIHTRLLLFVGEWWENTKEGIAVFQSILGRAAGNEKSRGAIDNLIKKRILETQYVTGIQSLTSSYDSETRKYSVSIMVNTQFGSVVVSNS